MSQTETTFKTKDWQEASLLLASGLKLSGMERNGACFFIFEGRGRATALVEGFWRGDAVVNVRAFTDAQRRIKDLIFRGHNGNGRQRTDE